MFQRVSPMGAGGIGVWEEGQWTNEVSSVSGVTTQGGSRPSPFLLPFVILHLSLSPFHTFFPNLWSPFSSYTHTPECHPKSSVSSPVFFDRGVGGSGRGYARTPVYGQRKYGNKWGVGDVLRRRRKIMTSDEGL